MHDYGKLNIDWQKPMQKYQALKERVEQSQFNDVLGHTDFNGKDDFDKELARQVMLFRRPPHAGVGAFALQEVISDLYNNSYIKSSIPMQLRGIITLYPKTILNWYMS